MSPTKTWKKVEREVAAFFGATRTPLSGGNSRHKTKSDTLNEYIYVETKYAARHAVVKRYFEELPKARAEGKPLVLAVKQKSQSNPPFLLVFAPGDLLSIARLLRKSRREHPCLLKKRKAIRRKR